MSSTASHRFLTGALSLVLAAGTLGAAACGSDDDISRDRFFEDFSEESPLEEAVDECIVDRLFESLDQSQINDFYSEDPSEDLSDDGQAALEEATRTCTAEAGEGPDDEAEPGA